MAFVQDRELDIQGSLMYVKKDFETAMQTLLIEADDLITHRFNFDALEVAFELAIDPTTNDEKLKVMLNF